MRRIVTRLLTIALVPAMMQSGMAEWVPHGDADQPAPAVAQHGDSAPAHSSLASEDHAHGKAPPRDSHAGRCYVPEPGCGCAGCIDYFNAHSFTLPSVGAAAPQITELGRFDGGAIALFTGLNHPPPTPPPRS